MILWREQEVLRSTAMS